jgi:hypothetical protein
MCRYGSFEARAPVPYSTKRQTTVQVLIRTNVHAPFTMSRDEALVQEHIAPLNRLSLVSFDDFACLLFAMSYYIIHSS